MDAFGHGSVSALVSLTQSSVSAEVKGLLMEVLSMVVVAEWPLEVEEVLFRHSLAMCLASSSAEEADVLLKAVLSLLLSEFAIFFELGRKVRGGLLLVGTASARIDVTGVALVVLSYGSNVKSKL